MQSAHSALEAGREFGKPLTTSHLILIGAKSEYALRKIANELDEIGIKYHLFYEPDISSYTSLTTEPLDQQHDYFFKHNLYKFRAPTFI